MQNNSATTIGLSGNILIDGLMVGARWAQTSLTYAFPTSFAQYGSAYPSLYGNGFAPFSEAYQANVRYWLDQISNTTLLTFTVGAPETATLRWGRFNDPNNLAYAYYPSSADVGGDQWFANNENSPGVPGDTQMRIILHELGHALGLKHPHDSVPSLPAQWDSNTYSAMSYNTYEGGNEPGRYSRPFNHSFQTLPLLDMQALQYLYGANFNYNDGDTVYRFDGTNGTLFINGQSQGVVAGNRIFRSIWDGGGHDVLDLTNFKDDQIISLVPGEWSLFSRAQLAANSFTYDANNQFVYIYEPGNLVNPFLYNGDPRSLIEEVRTGPGNDSVKGNQAANVIATGEGSDTLTGGLGADTLIGGAGADEFRDTATGLTGDTIADFGRADRIVISDASLANFAFSVSGKALTFSGGSLTLAAGASRPLLAAAAAAGGVQLTMLGNLTADFNGDGLSDLLLQNTTSGLVTLWRGQANGTLSSAGNPAPNPLDASWKVAGLGDFNGDGREDILWRHSSGVIGQWSGQTGVFTNNSGVAANPVDNSWSVVGVADYNGDGRDDILWRHSSGEIGQWLAQPNGSFANNGGAAANLVDPSWTVKASGDFNGDGRADILWQHTSGVYAEWLGSATGKLNNAGGVMTGATGSVVGSGDFNGDGRDDILMRNSTTGQLTVWQGQTGGQFTATSPSTQLADLNWKVVGIGDYNGDGRDDLIWKHSNGTSGLWLGTVADDFASIGAGPVIPTGSSVIAPDIWVI